MSAFKLLEKTTADSLGWDMDVFLNTPAPRTLAFLNAHGVTTARRNEEFANFLLSADKLLRDGIGVKIALKLFGFGKTENLNGTDLITVLLEKCRKKKIVIYGASDEVMAVIKQKLLLQKFQHLLSTKNGFYEDEIYLNDAQEKSPEVILLCMGMPRQEILAAKLKELGFQGLIICGGGWADFYTGMKPRAPLWMRKMGMEWVFRLLNEPGRLGKRYTVDIIFFFYVVLQDYWRIRKQKKTEGEGQI